jgi:AcrR family transcriptional regulator
MRAQTRAALLQAAQELLLENGYSGTGIRDITARAGLSLATFYLHFRSKDELVQQIGDELSVMYSSMMRDWTENEPIGPDIRRRAQVAFNRFLDATAKRKTLFLLMLRDWSDTPAPARRGLENSRTQWVKLLAQDLSRGVEAGHLDPFPAEVAAEAIVAAFIRLTRGWLEDPSVFPREAVVDTLVKMTTAIIRAQVKKEFREMLLEWEKSQGIDW